MTSTKQNEFKRLGRRLVHNWRNESPLTVMKLGADKLFVKSVCRFKKRTFKDRTFVLFDQEIPYFIHDYNATWRSERCIEIAAALHFLKQWPNAEILELGNVMSYYSNHSHHVVDKYEQSRGVNNVDFIELEPAEPFDGFVSISTFEHIGWDESPREAEKVKFCIDKIRSLVKSPDKVFVTFPLGYNEYLDGLAMRGELPFRRSASLIRVDDRQNWKEVDVSEALNPEYRYGHRFPMANACFFGLGLVE